MLLVVDHMPAFRVSSASLWWTGVVSWVQVASGERAKRRIWRIWPGTYAPSHMLPSPALISDTRMHNKGACGKVGEYGCVHTVARGEPV